jgi:hypothetical protein
MAVHGATQLKHNIAKPPKTYLIHLGKSCKYPAMAIHKGAEHTRFKV